MENRGKKKVLIVLEDENHLPQYETDYASGADVRAANREEISVEPGSSVLIPTGIRLEIPEGYEIQIRPRSGLAAKHQITVLNTPGTIDSDYRGELKIILINHGKQPFLVSLDDIMDKDGNPIESAPHAMMTVLLKTDRPIVKGAILRKERQDSVAQPESK